MKQWPNIFFGTLLFAGFALLFARVVDVSLIRGNYYRNLSFENRVRKLPIPAPRGILFDRNGVPLVENVELKKIARFVAGQPVELLKKDDVAEETSEVAISYSSRKAKGNEVAHVVGYTGEANREEVEKLGCPESIYSLGDYVGRSGAEAAFDCALRGKNGEELVEVDTRGRKVRILGKVEPEIGEDITLSIDANLQKRATSALEDKKGAVVVLNPRTGEILALVSSPTFDPNTISTNYQQLTTNPDLPLFNRATSGAYPPGSTFKIITAAAGLETGIIDENFRFTDPGVVQVGAFSYANWYFTQYGKLEGEIDIVRAITRSTDTFFYKIGEFVGVDKLAEWAEKFGLGKKTGIDIGGETDGTVPTPEWKERVKGERWFLGNTYHLAIGQGDITATPLQVAVMTSVIANGGKLCTPHISKSGKLQNNQISNFKFQISNCRDVGLSEKTLDIIRRGMVGACSPGGTAFPLFDFKVKNIREPESMPANPIQVACKTGTAEFGAKDKTHAWLTAFAPASAEASAGGPADDPEIVVTALVEEGGEGSRVAAPIVKEVLEEWFSR